MTRSGKLSWLLMAGAAATALTLSSPALAASAVEKGATVAATDEAAPVNFQVFLPLRHHAELKKTLADLQDANSPSYHKFLTPAQFDAQFGPSAKSVARVQARLTAAGLTVTGQQGNFLQVSGTAGQVNKLLQTRLNSVRHADGHHGMVAASRLILPAEFEAEGARVAAFSAPRLRPFATKTSAATQAISGDARQGPNGPYWFTDMKQAYDHPSYQSILSRGKILDGTGVKVAVVISDLIYPEDVPNVFTHEKFQSITGKPAPTVTTQIVVPGGVLNGDGSFEASLDVQQVLSGAPGASVTIYDINDLQDDHIMSAYNAVVSPAGSPNAPAALLVNSSFGGCELDYTPAYNEGTDFTFILTEEYESIFDKGNAEGVTFVASSGDQGGPACPDAGYVQNGTPGTFGPGISFPSGSPDVTAVGGGNLMTTNNKPALPAIYVGENGFGDPEIPYDIYGFGANVSGGYWGAGGGLSQIWPKPAYQNLVGTGSATFRSNPDIGMQVGGCPGGISVLPCGPNRSAAIIAFGTGPGEGGGFFGVIGTSVSSPELVGVLALYVQQHGAQGNINPYLYQMAAAQTAGGPAYYKRNIPGFDGVYTDTQPNGNQTYNYIYGNGSPDVRLLFGWSGFAAAGNPQTASNP